MKKRFLISILLAFLIFFYIQMTLQEVIIKNMMYCDTSWKSYSNACQYIYASEETINKAINDVISNDAVVPTKKLLYVDFGFMICLYPLIYLFLTQLTTLYDKRKKGFIQVIKILGYCQFLSMAADVTENIILLRSLDHYELTVSNATIGIVEYIKWGFASIGILVFFIAIVIWAIGFVRETEKASADLNY